MDGYNSYQNGTEKKDFNQTTQNIGSSIQKISQNVVSMQKMVGLIGTSLDTPELRKKLQQIQHYTNALAKDTSLNILQLSNTPTPHSPTEHKEHKMQKERLMEDYTSALNVFQETQRLSLLKQKFEITQKNTGESILPPPPNSRKTGSNSYGQLIELTPNTQTQMQLQQEERENRALEEQQSAMRQLEEDITGVNEIFKELGNLVHDQGEIVDSIEASVESANVYVSEGTTHLREANRLKVKLRKYKLVLLLIPLTVLICLIILISWHSN